MMGAPAPLRPLYLLRRESVPVPTFSSQMRKREEPVIVEDQKATNPSLPARSSLACATIYDITCRAIAFATLRPLSTLLGERLKVAQSI